jgi:hypothetical protein
MVLLCIHKIGRYTMNEIPEVSFRTIELIHDISRMQWGIPLGDGRYFYIAQQLLDYANDLEGICEYINTLYDADIPVSVYRLMRDYRDNTSRYVKIPILNPIDWSTFYAGVDDE